MHRRRNFIFVSHNLKMYATAQKQSLRKAKQGSNFIRFSVGTSETEDSAVPVKCF
jgi:histidinol-phosphate/aromatic aminotransferase/cobyric acid decarboxylase-like protein